MIVVLMALTLLLTCIGQLLQKSVATRTDHSHQVWWLLAIIGCLGLGAVFWLLVLQRLPVGIAYPMLSLNFVLVMAASRWWFKETVSPRQWCGVLCIILGVSLLGGYA